VLQGFSHDEVAQMLGCCPKTIMRQLPDALDKLSGIFLTVGILKPIGEPVNADGEPCQEAKTKKLRNHVIREEKKNIQKVSHLPLRNLVFCI
jgi:hypothetical protein